MTIRHNETVHYAWDGVSDFYEDDEPPEDIEAAWASGTPVVTGKPASVLDVAAALLDRLGPLDGLQIQKLCYLVQANHLAATGLAAFLEPVEAWANGPVIDKLYQQHKRQPLITTIPGDPTEVDDTLTDIINEVIGEYGHWSGLQLRALTHGQPPWLDAREGLAPDARSRHHITPGAMREYFYQLRERADETLDEELPF